MSSILILVLILVASVVGLIVITAWQAARRRREWEHAERMRALEMGLPVPRSESWIGKTAVALGLGVPMMSFLFACYASDLSAFRDSNHPIWSAVLAIGVLGVIGGALVGVLGVICGMILSIRQTATISDRQLSGPGAGPGLDRKPAFDPDAFDTVGRRG